MRRASGSEPQYDVIVVGGGPAGSTTAALLAQHGRRVLLVEREPFPRYHIGESLIPYTWFTLDRLGVLDWLKRSGSQKKYIVQFVSIAGKVSQPFYFYETLKHECATTWQVWRGEFDAMLLDNARAKGAEVRQGVSVRDVIMDGDRVVGVQTDAGNGGSEAASVGRSAIRSSTRSPSGPITREPSATRVSTKARRRSRMSPRRAGSGTSHCTPTP